MLVPFRMISIWLYFVILYSIFISEPWADSLTVQTISGTVSGFELTSRLGRKIYGFTKVPYAKPPTGNLRFAEPTKVDPWQGVLSANEPSPDCVQYNFIIPDQNKITGQEDCLYLNIYTPNVKPGSDLPVLCYFPGGFWTFGGIRNHNPEYILDADIVFVGINYRLGALGFLSTEDSALPGNLGLKDQIYGLQWIKENIKNFGGDPKQITVFGEGTGGSSAHLHMYSPLSKGLFHRCISMSGTALSPFAVLPPGVGKYRGLQFLTSLGCKSNDTNTTLDCLRSKKANDIINAQKLFYVWDLEPIVIFGPVVEIPTRNSFITVHPFKTRSTHLPWMTGISSGEGLLRTARFIIKPDSYANFSNNFNEMAPIMLLFNNTSKNPRNVSESIRNYYFGSNTITESSIKNLTDMYTDGVFLYPTIESLKKHPGPSYLYYFNYLGKSSNFDFLSKKRVINESAHSDELIYIFNSTQFSKIEGRDEAISATLIKYITNFVISGHPTPRRVSERAFLWNEWKQKKRYMNLSEEASIMYSNMLQERYKFWTGLNLNDGIL